MCRRYGVYQLEKSEIRKLVILPLVVCVVPDNLNSAHLRLSVLRHEGQEGRQVGELEPHERALDENIETKVVVVSVATERWRSCQRQIHLKGLVILYAT